MPEREFRYNVSFRDFQFLQVHMTRRVFARNRGRHLRALASVVLCALLLTFAITLNVHPALSVSLLDAGIPYPLSFYVLLIAILVAAILALIPAIRLRTQTIRMQVSDNGPLLGATRLVVEPHGLIVERDRMSSHYAWSAFQGVELAKEAVILPIDNGMGLIIPGAAFASAAERYDFAATVAKRIESQQAEVDQVIGNPRPATAVH